jgi:hypothetical protein
MDRKKDIEESVKKMVADFQERNVDTSIRVFVTHTSEAKSFAFTYGGGDYFAQYGCVADWLEKKKAETWHDAQCHEEGGQERAL